ncbi:hypothetical protein HOU74_gp41 [Pectobacterium phage Phoria]|uniref:Transposase n=1 Tax=Pectobacterium phage Phoria TaxID=2489634 RepID=A0A3G8FJI6_9CAUD|nr:hypothetical protein HOU74_gp41 [Pectobacterium phage Phoria]AZF94947.1 hypothetical protein [Pectobacterium phage Phoria]
MAERKSPRQFSVAFKIDVVKKVLDGTYESQSDAARKLDIFTTVVSRWVNQYKRGHLQINNAIAVSSKPNQVIKPATVYAVQSNGVILDEFFEVSKAVFFAKEQASVQPNHTFKVMEMNCVYSVTTSVNVKETSYV